LALANDTTAHYVANNCPC